MTRGRGRGRATSGEKKSTMFSQAFACFV